MTKKDNARAAGWVRMNTPTTIPMLSTENMKIADRPRKRGKLPLKGMWNQASAKAGIRTTLSIPTRM